MAKFYGYINPLLSNLAEDYSKKTREGLIGQILYPRITAGKPSGEYAVYDKAGAYKAPDVTMAGERSQAHEFNTTGVKKPCAATPYALKSFISKDGLEFMEGPFKLWEKQKVEMIAGKLEMAQEKRVADTVLSLAGRTTALTGTGNAKTDKWVNSGGNPFEAVQDAVKQLFYRPNLMVLSESVFDALEYHPKLLEKLGEANLIKKVSEETLSKLFRINRVVIAKGRAGFGKENASRSATPTGIWGDCVVLACTSNVWDEPCAGKTLAVKYAEADGQGYVVRSWDEEDGGVLGGEYVQVAHNVVELTVAPDLQYAIKEVL